MFLTKEQKFDSALQDVFVGAKVEGESGYINLMRIKARYYEKVARKARKVAATYKFMQKKGITFGDV